MFRSNSKKHTSRRAVLRNQPSSKSSTTHLNLTKEGPTHVIVDVDAGIDDAWALFMLLRAHQNPEVDFRIEAITCVNGNTKVDNVIVNVTRILLAMNVASSEIPIYRGAESALTIDFVEEPPYYGNDGFGDANLEPVVPIIQGEHAVLAITRLAQQFPGLLTVLALGPLTNLALAVNHNPEIKYSFKEIVILGGNLNGYGNVSPSAEFNFITDAEAARTVLESFKCPMTIMPVETVQKAVSTYSFRVDVLGVLDTPQVRLMNQVEAKHLENNRETWSVADAAAAAVLLEPSLIVRGTESHFCTVELSGVFTRGMMVVDRGQFISETSNAIIITEIDQELYERMLITAAGGPYYQP